MADGKITKYYHSKPPCIKKRRVEIVKWFEPSAEDLNVNKFLVVYEDGTIYIFYTKAHLAEEENKAFKIPSKDGPTKEIPVDQIINMLQKSVEDYDFNVHYTKRAESKSDKVQLIFHE